MRYQVLIAAVSLSACGQMRPPYAPIADDPLHEELFRSEWNKMWSSDTVPSGFLESTFEFSELTPRMRDDQRTAAVTCYSYPEKKNELRSGTLQLQWHPDHGIQDGTIARAEGDTLPISQADTYANLQVRLLVFTEYNGFLRVAPNTLDGGVWVREEDLAPFAYHRTFMDHFTAYALWNITGYHDNALMSGPSDGAPMLVPELDERIHKVFRFTGRTDNVWAEVIIYEVPRGDLFLDCYSEEELMEFRTDKQWVGWLRVLNNDGSIGPLQVIPIC